MKQQEIPVNKKQKNIIAKNIKSIKIQKILHFMLTLRTILKRL